MCLRYQQNKYSSGWSFDSQLRETIFWIWRVHKWWKWRNSNINERYELSKKINEGEKYKASMLRKETCKEFSENYQTSRKWLKLLQRRLERYELSRMYQKAISTCDTRFRKKNDRRRNTRNIKQNFISAPSSSISRSECRHDWSSCWCRILIQRRTFKKISTSRSQFTKQPRWYVIEMSKLQNCFGCRLGNNVPSDASSNIRYGFSYIPVGRRSF